MKKLKTHAELHAEWMKNPEYKSAYEEFSDEEVEFQIIQHVEDGREKIVFDSRLDKLREV
ncbi:hypothetical protein [Xenorhabdus bharatensis]|uniref:hypothetical protein n=1 Tax=Xenorhabdus bharatensis TaxID=3136256 RepID=UPI0030F48A0E